MKLYILIAFALIASVYSQILQIDNNCGKGTPLRNIQKRIVGGSYATKGNWGWQVLIEFNGGFVCGGSLINNQWILTAASCVYRNANPTYYTVKVGLYDTNLYETYTVVTRVSKIVINPSYNDYYIRNDIALLKISTPVGYDYSTFRIIPVCVPDGYENYQGRTAWATGWGTSSSSSTYASRYLSQVSMQVLTDSRCIQKFSPNYQIDQYTQLCAGETNQMRDTCQYDTGGPLVVRGYDGRWHLVGITSWGRNPCGNGGVYTRVSAYKDWIYNTLLIG